MKCFQKSLLVPAILIIIIVTFPIVFSGCSEDNPTQPNSKTMSVNDYFLGLSS